MADPQLLTAGTLLAGRYEIVKLLGRGGMGAVYLARDARLPTRQVAVKELWPDALDPAERDEARALFEREANLLAGLEHPHLPRVSDHFSENNRQYLVMDFVEGDTLEHVIEYQGPQPLPTVLKWGLQLADLLDYLHSRPQPIILRDLKPPNVMITPKGNVKVIDFGIARIYQPGKAADTVAFGTPGFAAPEQYGKAQSDARVDIYGLGATLHNALTGHDPGTTPFRFDPVPGIPPPVDEAIRMATRHESQHRYASASAMANALQQAAAQAGVTIPGTVTTGLLPPPTAMPTQQLPKSYFQPPEIHITSVRRGETPRVPFQIQGDVHGLLVASQRWIRVEPRRVKGTNPAGEIILYTNGLAEGREHVASIVLRDKATGESMLPVRVRLEAARMSWWSVLLAVLLTIATLIPVAGLIAFLFMTLLYFSCPLDERPSLRPFIVASSFIATLNAALSAIVIFAIGKAPAWMPFTQ